MSKRNDEINKLFKLCKEEIEKRKESTKYFTKAFFEKYIEFERIIMLLEEGKIDRATRDKYVAENIFPTDFYNKNSGAYCEFLSIAYSHKDDFRRIFNI